MFNQQVITDIRALNHTSTQDQILEISTRTTSKQVYATEPGMSLLETFPNQAAKLLFDEQLGKHFTIRDPWSGLAMNPGLNSVVFKACIGRNLWKGHLGETIAVKTPYPPDNPDTTALEQFTSLRLLQNRGFLTVPLLFATSDRLITRWWNGKHKVGVAEEELFREFHKLIEEEVSLLKQTGEWTKDIHINTDNCNYFVENLNSTNPKEWFRILDPIFRRTRIEW